MVREGTPEAKQVSASALWNLACGNNENKTAIATAGGIEPLVALAREGMPEQKAKAAGALRNIVLGNVDHRAAIVAAGGIEPLVALAREGTPEQKESAADALWALACDCLLYTSPSPRDRG